MKQQRKTIFNRLSNHAVGWVGAGLLAGAVGSGAAELNLSIDNKPLDPVIKQASSYAPILKKVAPSVVNIFSTKMVEQPYGAGRSPYMDDSLFRFFFNDPAREGNAGNSEPRLRRESNLGSGVIVTEDGYLLTNHHVIEGADEIKVAIPSLKKEYDAILVGSDPQTDIAVLKIEDVGLPVATLTDSDLLEVGDTVLAIGNPFGVGQAVTLGIVSAKGRGMGLLDYEDFIQTDASTNPGNSGGALVDAEGRLVGINTAILSRSGGNQGVGFAIPINLARLVLDRIMKDGAMTRGYLGVYIQAVTPGLALMFELDEDQGALVSGVIPGSPAEAAGLKEGDVIVEMAGEKVTDNRDLRFNVAKAAPGTVLSMIVVRDGQRQEFKAELEVLQANAIGIQPERKRFEPESMVGAMSGVELSGLNSNLRERYGVPQGIDAVLVSRVDPRSPAFEAGLRPGDVILSVNRKKTTKPSDVFRLNRKAGTDPVLLLVWSRHQGSKRYLLIEPDPEP